MNYDLIVIGGGAAGLLCAGQAAGKGLSVLTLEKMPIPGRKLMITGKGRCNVTNCCDIDDFMAHMNRNPRFMYSSLNQFSPYDVMAFFEDLGVPLKVERGARVFPQSDKAADIVDALVGFVKKNGGVIRQGTVKNLLIEDQKIVGVETLNKEKIFAQKVVVATGGKSYPATGSTGDGYLLARQAGHSVVSPKASLVPVIVKEPWCKDLMGLSLKNCTLEILDTQKNGVIYRDMGEMLFTHFGVSGPMTLSASMHMEGKDLSKYKMIIDLKPALSEQELDARLLRDFDKYKNKDFQNALGDLLPQKMIPVFVQLSGISGTTKVHQITKEQRQTLVQLLKGFTLTAKAFRPIEEAVITTGGVDVAQIDPKTMQSKLVEGLYFIGEVLDVDGYTGGFNLQIAFSTGFSAAKSV